MGGGGGGGGVAPGRGVEVDIEDAAASTATAVDDVALQVIVLGAGGGPLESNVTALLVRSLSSGWRRGSVIAVDAGVHLSAIVKILEDTQPPGLGETEEFSLPHILTTGPFAGLEVPYAKAKANASYIHQTLIDTYLITHPHLDHISGFVINTAALPGTRPKRLAGLPSTIAAFRTHIFNNVIWPNLSDENNGAGLVTYMRLVEGGSPALGEGDGKGYLEISDGLAVKVWGVSHGHCIERHSHRGSGSGRHGSFDAGASSSQTGPLSVGMGSSMAAAAGMLSPRALAHHNSANPGLGTFLQQQREQERLQSGGSGLSGMSTVASVAGGGRANSISGGGGGGAGGLHSMGESVCVYDSSAYFIRDVVTGREVLIFGDVEPDSISLSPRNQQVWQEAAPKIAAGKLAAIFIECSYDDSQSVDRLFGHLAPRFIVEEMSALAAEVMAVRHRERELEQEREVLGTAAAMERANSGYASGSEKKRKREGSDAGIVLPRRKTSTPQGAVPRSTPATSAPSRSHSHSQTEDPVSPKTIKPSAPPRGRVDSAPLSEDATESPHLATPTAELSLGDLGMSGPATPMSNVDPVAPPPAFEGDFGDPGAHVPLATEEVTDPEMQVLPLRGLKIAIIHVKDKLNDGPPAGDVILDQLRAHETEAPLGCEYIMTSVGQDLYL